jgi:hypothetical protein
MKSLTEHIEQMIGARPQIFKAGRYGISRRTLRPLIELGYKVDTSIVPYTSYEGLGGGPDFSHLPHQPFWLNEENRLLEVPLSRAVIGPLAQPLGRFMSDLFDGGFGQSMHLPGFLTRLLRLERLTLSPEASDLAGMKRLVEFELNNGRRTFTLSMHSSSLVVGGSPYAETQENVDQLLLNTAGLLEAFVDEFGGKLISMLDLYEEANALCDGAPRADAA